MVYLVIMFLVAAAGVASLWVQQRRQRAHLETVDGFRSSLERLSDAPVRGRRVRSDPPAPRRAAPARRPVTRHAPLDPARRAAAKKRIDARRRAARSRAL